MIATGTFEITSHPEPPWETVEGVALARVRFVKRFAGPLDATSEVQMMAARGPVADSAGYVALERVTGPPDGHAGRLVPLHTRPHPPRARPLPIAVVPDSGTGALAGLRGTMDIQVEAGQHRYAFTYEIVA